jgi:hypothetical protein
MHTIKSNSRNPGPFLVTALGIAVFLRLGAVFALPIMTFAIGLAIAGPSKWIKWTAIRRNFRNSQGDCSHRWSVGRSRTLWDRTALAGTVLVARGLGPWPQRGSLKGLTCYSMTPSI